jgi:NADH-quinone oxidoreductase subunit E
MTEAGEWEGRASEPILRDGEQPMSTGSNQEGEAPARFSGETRETSWEALEVQTKEIIARYPQPRSALLPLLHLLQAEEGYVSPYGIEFAAEQLDLTTAEVAAVATFYTMYKRRPVGAYHVGVCTNTLCAVMGGDTIFAALKEHLGVGNDETTEDGAVTLEHIECNAACDFAPVVLVDRLRSGNLPTPSRGADHLCTWKEASRVLAGFSDGRATEGANVGPATLVGLTIAKERGWSAPEPGAQRTIADNDSEGRDGGQ